MQEFEAVLYKFAGKGGFTYTKIPFNVPEIFGAKGIVPVRGTVDGVNFKGTSIWPTADGTYCMFFKKELRDKIKKGEGDAVYVVIEKDTTELIIPADFQEVLDNNPAAKAAFETFPKRQKRTLISDIESAKRLETRLKRIDKAIQKISNYKK